MFKPLKPMQLDVAVFIRSEQNTEAAFQELIENRQLPVLLVSSSASVTSYVVKPNDVFIVVDSSGGPMKIVLPSPPGATQAVSIKNAKGRKITVVQSDGKVTGDGIAVIDLEVGASTQMVATTKAWFDFGRA